MVRTSGPAVSRYIPTTTKHFVSTEAKLAICPRCTRPVLRAHDEGIPACVDLVPLPNLGAEIAAIARGLWTYTRLRNGYLAYRDTTRLADPAMAGQVHAEHACKGASA
ncbi:hypothetical protein ACQPZX_41490 [Actinoplanes sp. CA-142083]|uniref:hypothetical protein n=1 Tax=Actinoplanes sp. CA-142083 TaxID=3239903 RepID=UPI003D8A43A2